MLTYSEAIEKVLIDNGNFASLKYIYDNIFKYREKTGKTPNNTIQEKVQRDERFSRIAYGVYALTSFIKDIEINDLGYFSFSNNEMIFIEQNKQTSREIIQNVRVGQNIFRNKLIDSLKICPITGISDKRLLIASHIKPWAHSNDLERLDVYNGFLLSPLFDKLFDKNVGLITFSLSKEVIISKRLSIKNVEKLGVYNKQVFPMLPISGREKYLEYHNKYIFQH